MPDGMLFYLDKKMKEIDPSWVILSHWIPKGWLKVNIKFTVENFSDLKNSAISEPKYLQNHDGKIFRNLPWQIKVRPEWSLNKNPEVNENIPLKRKCVGFFLQCNGESKPSFTTVNLRIINHKDSSHTYERSILFDSNPGFSHFMTWQEAIDPELGFIKDGAVTFEANIQVREDSLANIPNPGRLYARDPNEPKGKDSFVIN